MKKALTACVGMVSVSFVAYLLKEPDCLWALFVVYWIVQQMED